jgi:glycosyltransferase involved in cell wall biosynthesis
MTSVLFDTLWHDFSDGWATASRVYARAMKRAGLGVQLHSWMGAIEEPSPEVLAEVAGMLEPLERDLYLFSCTLSSAERSAYSVAAIAKLLRPRAFYTMFERKRIETGLATSLNEACDGVMVPCSANREALAAAGCLNASYVPYPYFPDDPHLALAPQTGEPRVFYWIGRWEPRKAPHNLIKAFLQAFGPGEAELHLKLGPVPWPGYPEPEDWLVEELSDPAIEAKWPLLSLVHQGVHIHRGRWPSERVMALHASGHIYVSASRGEGLDLPAFAAKLAGRRVVTTDSGGPRDFLTETDILVPAPGEVPAEARYRWGPGAVLADYAIDDLIAAMQAARADTRPPERISESFHVDNVAPQLKAWAEEIVARVPRERDASPKLTGFAEWMNGDDSRQVSPPKQTHRVSWIRSLLRSFGGG